MKLPSPPGERARERGATLLLALLTGLCSCAPTSVAPTVIRMAAPAATDTEFHFGLRTGPRIPSVVETVNAGAFSPSIDGTLPPELGAVYEFDYTRVLWRQLALHGSVQAEFFGGIPLPSLGVGLGVSYRWQLGRVSIAPALGGRGATSFGINMIGGTGHFLSGDVSLTLSVAGSDRSRIGLVPFASVQQTFGADVTSAFFGGLVAVRYDMVEVFGGVGRAYLFPAGPAWNVPLVGVRVGGS
jgi:hypothetical protein